MARKSQSSIIWWLALPVLAALYLLFQIVRYNLERLKSPFRFFTYSEFDSPDLAGSGERFMNAGFIYRLDRIRARVGFALVITSGYRTWLHNQHVGGTNDSSHMSGYAADIYAPTYSMKLAIARAAIAEGITRIGWGSTFIHLDIDPAKPQQITWGYSGSTPPTYESLAA